MGTLVLLSGGMDSVAALHWVLSLPASLRLPGPLSAIGFDYGQPHRIELAAADRVAKACNVPFDVLHIGHAVRGHRALVPAAPGLDLSGVSRANLPARNAIFLSSAAAYGASRWPSADLHLANLSANLHLVIGANADDASAFPDCQRTFMDAMEDTLSLALRGIVPSVRIETPWFTTRKAGILRWAKGQHDAGQILTDILSSVSCYAGTRCNACDACRLRRAAFEELSLTDGYDVPVTHGGDPQREIRR